MNAAPVSPPAAFTRRGVAQNIAALFTGSAVAQGLTALTLLLTARQLGAMGYGQYASCLVAASLSSIVFSLGQDLWLLRQGGRQPELVSELASAVLLNKFLIGLLWLGALLIIAPWLSQETFPAGLFRLAALTVLVDGLFTSAVTALKSALRNRLASLLEAACDFTWLITTLLLIRDQVQNASVYFLVRLVALSIFLGAALLILQRLFRLRRSWQVSRLALEQSPPFAASEFLAWTALRLDVLIIALILGRDAVGLYSPAVGIVNALFWFPAAVYMVFVPVLSRLMDIKPSQAWQTAWRGFLLQAFLGLGTGALLFLGAGPLTSLLGESYAGSRQVLQTLSVLMFFKSLSFAAAAVLVAAGLQARRTLVQAAAVMLNACLNFLFLSRAGILGAAWFYVASEILLCAGYSALAFQAWRANRQPPPFHPSWPA